MSPYAEGVNIKSNVSFDPEIVLTWHIMENKLASNGHTQGCWKREKERTKERERARKKTEGGRAKRENKTSDGGSHSHLIHHSLTQKMLRKASQPLNLK